MSKLFCPNCGKEVDDTWKTCPYCGFDLASIKKESSPAENEEVHAKEPESQPDVPPLSNRAPAKKKWVTVAIVAVIIIIVVPLVLYFSTGSIQVIYHSILHNNITIYIDGSYKGEFPSDTYISFYWIKPGTHTVEATTTGGTFLDEKTVTVNPGQTTTVELSYMG